jgi:hypothetical protein
LVGKSVLKSKDYADVIMDVARERVWHDRGNRGYFSDNHQMVL